MDKTIKCTAVRVQASALEGPSGVQRAHTPSSGHTTGSRNTLPTPAWSAWETHSLRAAFAAKRCHVTSQS